MTQPSRREFLAVSAAGAAAVGVTTFGGGLLTAGSAEAATPPNESGASTGPIVAEIRDARTGEIILMTADSEITVFDVALAAQIAHLVGTEA